MSVLEQFLGKVIEQIINPFILLMVAVAFVVFLWGLFEFVKSAGDKAAKEKGRYAIMWGLIGLVVMFGAYGIVNVVLDSFGVDERVAPITAPQNR